jgi:hypothetical protein
MLKDDEKKIALLKNQLKKLSLTSTQARSNPVLNSSKLVMDVLEKVDLVTLFKAIDKPNVFFRSNQQRNRNSLALIFKELDIAIINLEQNVFFNCVINIITNLKNRRIILPFTEEEEHFHSKQELFLRFVRLYCNKLNMGVEFNKFSEKNKDVVLNKLIKTPIIIKSKTSNLLVAAILYSHCKNKGQNLLKFYSDDSKILESKIEEKFFEIIIYDVNRF